ncbi:MAG: hypothetical protein NZM26_03540 [Patescibacteria group bacterium]|nr:hypothetical protein [Patescibacteria group bacterium]MCX7928605.1 hypothetical protein [Patescibacteria group bacterium]
MQGRIFLLLAILVLSSILFIHILSKNSNSLRIDEEIVPNFEQSAQEDFGDEVSLDKYFNFDSNDNQESVNQKITPSISKSKERLCLLDGQIVKEGTVNANTICVGQ